MPMGGEHRAHLSLQQAREDCRSAGQKVQRELTRHGAKRSRKDVSQYQVVGSVAPRRHMPPAIREAHGHLASKPIERHVALRDQDRPRLDVGREHWAT
jgi:hypothetical protein